jgi:hypothetical protein
MSMSSSGLGIPDTATHGGRAAEPGRRAGGVHWRRPGGSRPRARQGARLSLRRRCRRRGRRWGRLGEGWSGWRSAAWAHGARASHRVLHRAQRRPPAKLPAEGCGCAMSRRAATARPRAGRCTRSSLCRPGRCVDGPRSPTDASCRLSDQLHPSRHSRPQEDELTRKK